MGPSIGFRLRPGADDPLYRQLFDQIAARIRRGTFPPGYRLPPTRELATELGTHRNTVVRAYQELEEAGFVASTVGRGTFVADGARAAAGNPGTPPAEPATPAPLPWGSLLSPATRIEPLGRSDRLTRAGGVAASAGAVHLNKMQPSAELLPDDLLRRCLDHVLRTQGARALGYPPREGVPRLRTAIAEDLRRQGVPATADDLLITTGSQQALDVVARALVSPGDTVLVDPSTYGGALNLWSLAGARLVAVPTDDEGPDMGALERLGRAGAKAFYLMPNCHNPTGVRVSPARREALVAWSHQAGIPLVEDDYASDLNLDGARPPAALRTLDGEVLYLGTYSKKLAPSLRIGYLLSPRALAPQLAALKHALDLGTSAVLQHALAEFLERGYLVPHLGRTTAEYRRRRDALEESLRRALPSGTKWRRPETGVALWLETPPHMDPEALFHEAERAGVVISPGTLNALDPRQARGVRLTFCAEPCERIVEGGRRLGRAWAAVERRARPNPGRTATVPLDSI